MDCWLCLLHGVSIDGLWVDLSAAAAEVLLAQLAKA
jgi:hypothetical protein